jgi:hypothetical protein
MADQSKGLSFKLSEEQLKVLEPLIDATGKLKIAPKLPAIK